MIGYAICASFCTHEKSLGVLRSLASKGFDIVPIISENAYSTDTRFGSAESLIWQVEDICSRQCVHTVSEAEKFGPTKPLEALIICPCTGNTLAKLSRGITDTSVTMSAKAHLRCDRPVLLAPASNDALSANLENIARLISRKNIYFVPMKQDDPKNKPHSLVADFDMVEECFLHMISGKQKRPIFI